MPLPVPTKLPSPSPPRPRSQLQPQPPPQPPSSSSLQSPTLGLPSSNSSSSIAPESIAQDPEPAQTHIKRPLSSPSPPQIQTPAPPTTRTQRRTEGEMHIQTRLSTAAVATACYSAGSGSGGLAAGVGGTLHLGMGVHMGMSTGMGVGEVDAAVDGAAGADVARSCSPPAFRASVSASERVGVTLTDVDAEADRDAAGTGGSRPNSSSGSSLESGSGYGPSFGISVGSGDVHGLNPVSGGNSGEFGPVPGRYAHMHTPARTVEVRAPPYMPGEPVAPESEHEYERQQQQYERGYETTQFERGTGAGRDPRFPVLALAPMPHSYAHVRERRWPSPSPPPPYAGVLGGSAALSQEHSLWTDASFSLPPAQFPPASLMSFSTVLAQEPVSDASAPASMLMLASAFSPTSVTASGSASEPSPQLLTRASPSSYAPPSEVYTPQATMDRFFAAQSYGSSQSVPTPGQLTMQPQTSMQPPNARAYVRTVRGSTGSPGSSSWQPLHPPPPPLAPPPPPSTAASSSSSSSSSQLYAKGQSQGSGQSQGRRKNHACWMCHKSFDRPSTLRKHLLVHTGEKAFVCSICGRRFGVASNLNRHTRRCAALPVNNPRPSSSSSAPPRSSTTPATAATLRTRTAPSRIDATATAPDIKLVNMTRESTNPDLRRAAREQEGRPEPQDGDPLPPAPPPVSASTSATTRMRRTRSYAADTNVSGPSSAVDPPSSDITAAAATGTNIQGSISSTGSVVAVSASSSGTVEGGRRPKRQRRAPSPSHWIPPSLAGFTLDPCTDRARTPLPPVRPGLNPVTGVYEERDSYVNIENVDPRVGVSGYELRMPYHPSGWTGRLPGPAAALGGDLTNLREARFGAAGSGSGTGGAGGAGRGSEASAYMYEFSLTGDT